MEFAGEHLLCRTAHDVLLTNCYNENSFQSYFISFLFHFICDSNSKLVQTRKSELYEVSESYVALCKDRHSVVLFHILVECGVPLKIGPVGTSC